MELIERLLALPKFGTGSGLHRVQWLLDLVHQTYPGLQPDFIKVTGSNGKGSTCAMISSILRSFGLAEGLFISPHLVRFNERISICGTTISDADLENGFDWFQAATRQYEAEMGAEAFGAFECFTALAYWYFAKKGVHHGCFEAGIGGRLDSTRPIPGSICALTSLDLEHTQLLGATRELIGYDKLELCPPGGTLVLFPLKDKDLLNRLRHYARLHRVDLFETAARCRVDGLKAIPAGSQFHATIDNLTIENLTLPLLGEHQVHNALVAMATVHLYLKRLVPELCKERLVAAMRKGLAEVVWPGRASFLPGPPPIYYDVGHTPEAIATFLATLQPQLDGKRVLLLTGASHNKSIETMVASLVGIADYVICTRAWHMGSPVARIEAAVKAERPDLPRESCETIEEAVARALPLAREQDMVIVIAGGLFLSIEAIQAYHGQDPKQLRFF